jgi:integrase
MRAHELASLRLGDVFGEGGRIRDEIALDASLTKRLHAHRVFITAKLKKELGSYIKAVCLDWQPHDPLSAHRSLPFCGSRNCP